MNTHRSFLTRILILLSIAILSACSGGAQPSATESAVGSSCPQPSPKMEVTSTEVNLFTWAEYIPQEVIDCFQEVYGVQLHLDNFSSQEEMYAKMTKGATGYDVVQPADNFVQLMIQKGMLAKLDQSKLTVMNNFGAEFLNPPFDPGCQYSLPYQLGSSGIAYNSETITTAPTSYADLWNSEYAGKLVMLDDSRNIIGMTLLSLGYDVNTTDPAQLAEAKAKLIELVPNIRIFDSDSPKSALIAGDVDLGVVWATEGFAANLEKPSIQYVYPKEGVILWQDNFSITIDAAHSDAAYAWLNYLYQPDVFWMAMRDFSGVNPETAAIEYAKTNQPDVYAAYMESNITNIPADVVTNGHWLQDLGEATPLFDQLWTEVKGQ
ncbi:MAG: spermidine/putrescine ABC transporter substrate-binding protein [Chloroflexota bacterium]